MKNSETNYVYLSDQLESRYPGFTTEFLQILDENHVEYGIIKDTKDVWCRDYMPVQVSADQFTQFQYWPDYLEGYEELRTAPRLEWMSPKNVVTISPLVVDGGNVVKTNFQAILTDKIFKENASYTREKLLQKLKDLLDVDRVIIVPHLPYDDFGHADGMVRFYDEQTVLVSDFSKTQSKSWLRKFHQVLRDQNLKIIPVPYVPSTKRNEEGVFPATGCYINFLEIGDLIVIPAFGMVEDELMLDKMNSLYPDHQITLLDSGDIARDGGVLNCITWSIRRPDKLTRYGVKGETK